MNMLNAYSTTLFIAVYICITYVFLSHIISLTQFVYAYNSSYDYGKVLKDLCKKEYFEYETARFQVSDNSDDIKISTGNYQMYCILLLIISIMISVGTSAAFTVILYDTFFNEMWLIEHLNLAQGQNILLGTFLNSVSNWQYAAVYIYIIVYLFFAYLVIILVPLLPILHIILKLGNTDIDISPFNVKAEAYGPFIALFSVILVMRLMYYIAPGSLGVYLRMDRRSYNIHIVTFCCVFAFYIVLYFILGNIMNFFQNPDWSLDEGSSGAYWRFYANLFGVYQYNDYSVQNVYLKRIPGIFFIALIVLLVMLFIFSMLFAFKQSLNDKQTLYYCIIIPLIILIIALITISNTTEFNAIVNKYILDVPSDSYKIHVKKIDDEFSKALSIEENNIKKAGGPKQYICRNVGNAILMALYSHLFTNITRVDRDDNDGGKNYIDITPEFIYDNPLKKCENTTEPFPFNTRKEYDISYYLNGKQTNKNIFYKFNQCSVINQGMVSKLSDVLYASTTLSNDNLLYCIGNVLDAYTYNKGASLGFIQDEKNANKVELLESFMNNNKLVQINFDKDPKDKIKEKYSDIVSKIVTEYNKIFTNIKNNYANKSSTFNNEYIKYIQNTITNTFNRINDILSEPITKSEDKNPITKYLIANYNSLSDEVYKKEMLVKIDKNSIDQNASQSTMSNEIMKPILNTPYQDIPTILQLSHNNLSELFNKLNRQDFSNYETEKNKISVNITNNRGLSLPENITITTNNYIVMQSDSKDIRLQYPADVLKYINDTQQTILNKIDKYHNKIKANLDTIPIQDDITKTLEVTKKNIDSLKIDCDKYSRQLEKMQQQKDKTNDLRELTRKQALDVQSNLGNVNMLSYVVVANYAIILLISAGSYYITNIVEKQI